MTTKRRLAQGLAAACSFIALAGAAQADPPGRVGRVSAVQGQVSFRPAGEDFWSPASMNLPATSGDAFWTDQRSRMELQIAGLEARLDGQSELDVIDLDWGVTRLWLPQGSVDLHVWRAPRGGVVVATPAGEVRITQPGVYRVDALPAEGDGDYGPVELTTFEGEALMPGDGGPIPVDAGQSATWLPGYDPDFEYAQPNDIDRWARMRDAEQIARRRQETLWASYTGADELDGAGDWINDPQYGQVWFPRDVGPDWAPYRYGHWSYVRPWGWTWIDDQPWGFTPFHYGRWARFGDRWGWVPGRPEAEPVYAPALVAFVGGGGWGVSIGVNGGALGWVPLAPQEVYVPTYHVSDDYVRRVNVAHAAPTVINTVIVNDIHNTTINNTTIVNKSVVVYRNAPAATVVPAAAFARGASVQQTAVKFAPGALAHAPVAPAALDRVVTPTREARAALPAGLAGQGPGRPNGAPAAGPQPGFANAPHPPAKLQVLRAAVVDHAAAPGRPAPVLRPSVPTASPNGKPLQLHVNGAAPNAGAPRPQGPPGANPSRPNGFAPAGEPAGTPTGRRSQPPQPPTNVEPASPPWAQRPTFREVPPAQPPGQPPRGMPQGTPQGSSPVAPTPLRRDAPSPATPQQPPHFQQAVHQAPPAPPLPPPPPRPVVRQAPPAKSGQPPKGGQPKKSDGEQR